jgi:hypothetical protein
VVFDPDGFQRLRLIPPEIGRDPIGFYTVYVENGSLVAVFSTRNGDFWARPNLTTGELSDVHEWR